MLFFIMLHSSPFSKYSMANKWTLYRGEVIEHEGDEGRLVTSKGTEENIPYLIHIGINNFIAIDFGCPRQQEILDF